MANKTNKRRDLKIIWSSNAPHTNSGYAVETRDLLFRFKKDGWDTSAIGFWGVEGFPITVNGEDLIDDRFKGIKLKVYPKLDQPFGGDALYHHSIDSKANVAFAMQDIWSLDPNYLGQLYNQKIPFIPYLPIDQEPIPAGVLNNLKFAYKILSFSKFGQQALEKEGFTSTMIPEGTDTQIFKPMDKVEVRKELGLPQDTFIFGMIGANKENPPRKGYQEALEAFQKFSLVHPEARIFFHTQQIAPGNFPILEYARYLGVGDKVLFLDQRMATWKADSKQIVKEINAFDIQLHPSQTEGFGLLIIESQACGVPVIVNRCHSMPELVIEGKTGEICETGKGHWRSSNGFVYPADVNSLYDKMETLYKKVKSERLIAKQCRDNILQNFDIDVIVKDKWIPFLNDLQEEVLGKPKEEGSSSTSKST